MSTLFATWRKEAYIVLGTYYATVDSKKRVTLPAPYRKEVGDEVLVLVPMEDCLRGSTKQSFEMWVDSLFEQDGKSYDPRDPEDVKLKEGLEELAVEVQLDSAGRLALGRIDGAIAGTLKDLGLLGDVAVKGHRDHFQIVKSENTEERLTAFRKSLNSRLYRQK